MVYLSSIGHGESAMWFNKESAAGQQGEKDLACKDTVRRGKGLFLNWFILSLLPSRAGFSYLVLLCRCKFRSCKFHWSVHVKEMQECSCKGDAGAGLPLVK